MSTSRAFRISLTTRLTAFFLSALAVVLVGLSVMLYLGSRSSLSKQADERLDAALSTLTAAVEFNEEGLEWEPSQRRLALGKQSDDHEVRWTVRDGRGVLVGKSENLQSDEFLDTLPPLESAGVRTIREVADGGRSWRVHQRRLDQEKRGASPSGIAHETLSLTAALDVAPMEAGLRALGRLSTGLSIGIWLLAAALGRRFCARALRPVAVMADAARQMGATEIDHRLPTPVAKDELQDLAEAFNGLLDRLQEAFERQTRFTGDASHQLRTPLAAMLGQIDVALRRERPSDEYRRTLSLVRDQAAHLGKIVEMLLFLARADAESVRPECPVIDLAVWAEDALSSWADHPREADIALEIDHEGPLLARVHPPLLGQLVDNLVDNACKYTNIGTRVRLRVFREGNHVVLEVADEGTGIAEEDRPHLFEPFYRSLRARRQGRPGVGLGLAVAQRIAVSLDGRLDVESSIGEGSAFRLTLPLVSEDVREIAETGLDTSLHARG